MKKILFFIVWLVIILFPVITLAKVAPAFLVVASPVRISNFIQRGFGLILFSLFFIQIILCVFMDKFIAKLGNWVVNFHIGEGVFAYFLALLHPIFFILTGFLAGGRLDPYAAFVNACLICKTPTDYFYTIGRVSFWLLSLAVFAAILRKTTPWLKANWKKFHVLNYLVFLLIGIHGFFLGADFSVQPFFTFAVLAYVVVLGIVVFIEIPRLYKNFRSWVNS